MDSPDPTLTDEELAAMEGRVTGIPSWHHGWMRYKADMQRLITALRASRAEVEQLKAKLPKRYDDSDLEACVARRNCDRSPCSCGMHRDRT